MRAGCFACQNKNPRTIRWKASLRGFNMNFWKGLSSDSAALGFASPNWPAEFNSTTPVTFSGKLAATASAVKPPRLSQDHAS